MRIALGSVVVALAFVSGAAAASPPAGFMSEPTLATRAATIAGKSVDVYCAQTEAAWESGAAQLSHAPEGTALTNVLGFVDKVGGSTIYLSPTTCAPLTWRKPKVAADLLTAQGEAIEVIAHESRHIAGDADEGVTDCDALAAMPTFAELWIPAKVVAGPHKTRVQREALARRNRAARARMLRLYVAGARTQHANAVRFSPAYRGPCG